MALKGASVSELGDARRTIEALLEELALRAYVFAVEPRDEQWELNVECATNGEWQNVRLLLDPGAVRRCTTDPGAKGELLRALTSKLGPCMPAANGKT